MDPSKTETSGQSRAANVSAAACDFSKLNRPSISLSMAIAGCFRTMFSIRTSLESTEKRSMAIVASFADTTSAARLRKCTSLSVTSNPGKKPISRRPAMLTSIPNALEAPASSRVL